MLLANKLFLFVCFVFYNSYNYAQTFKFNQYTTNNGLPIDNVNAAAQDKNNFLWFATDFGLAKFDGFQFANYSKQNGIANTSVIDIVNAGGDSLVFISYPITIQSINTIGKINTIGTIKGFSAQQLAKFQNKIFIYERGSPNFAILENGKLNNYNTNAVFNKKGLVINSIFTYKNNQLFYCTNMGLYVEQNDKVTILLENQNIQNGICNNNGIFIVTSNQLISIDNDVFKVVAPLPSGIKVLHMALEQDGTLWLRGIDKGIYTFTNNTLAEVSGKLRMTNKALNEFYKDNYGNLWFCTSGNGVLQKKKSMFKILDTDDGLVNNKILQLAQLKNGLVIGTESGITILQNNKLDVMPIATSQIGLQYVYKLNENNENEVGICIANSAALNTKLSRIVSTKTYKNIFFKKYESMFCYKQNNKNEWVVSGYEIINLDEKSVLKNSLKIESPGYKKTYTMCTYNNELWLGTNLGIIRVDAKNNISYIKKVNEQKIEQVFDFVIDQTQKLWIATDNGLLTYQKNQFQILEKGTTLGSNYCKDLLLDNKDRIWVATWDGMFMIEGNTKKYFNTADGLPSKTINALKFDEAKNELYIGSENGLVIANLMDLQLRKNEYKLHIDVLNNENGNKKDRTIYIANSNSLSFYISIPYYQGVESLVYEYKLDDNKWVVVKNPNVTISNIGSGKHVFLARAKITNEVITNDASFQFQIPTPFYKKWWFILLSAILLQFIIYKIINARNQKIKNKKLALQKQEAEFASLKQQAFVSLMNPHFIFNALNSIQHFINKQDRLSANKYLSDFATLIRRSFEAAQKSFVSLEEEIETLRLYMQLENMRFTNKFVYTINVADNVEEEEWMVPSMVIQPFLENAIIHGLMPLQDKGEIQIMVTSKNNILEICIIDNGVGIEKSKALRSKEKHQSRGMQLIKERLEMLGKLCIEPMQLQIIDAYPNQENTGTKIIWTMPFDLYENYRINTLKYPTE